jgi:multidrug efflux pump subunit AcrA (membrane-fusion protein)
MTEQSPLFETANRNESYRSAAARKPTKPGRRTARRLLLPGVALVPVLAVAGFWFARPDARPMIAAFASSAAHATEAAVHSLQERFAGTPAMERPDPVRNVRAMTVSPAQQTESRSFTGVVAARYETPLGFRVGGKIIERVVEVGAFN